MKTISLLLMMLTTAMSPLFSQKQLPASIQSYAVNWGYSLKQMFQAAGYDVPGPKSKVQLRNDLQTRTSELQLDSTVTYYGYEEPAQDSIPLFKNVYTYPQDNMEVMTEYFNDVDHWVPLNRTVLINDELGRLVDAFSQVYDDAKGDYVPDSRIEFYPHENSLTEADSFFVSGWAPELGEMHRILAVWNKFDDLGRLKESLTSTEIFEFPIVFVDRYAYNDDDELIMIESFLVDSGEEYPGSREIFFYENHLVIGSFLSVVNEDGSFVDESKKEYSYTPTGKEELVQSFVLDLEHNDWLLNHIFYYEYDETDRLTRKEESTFTEGAWASKLETYVYFRDEDLALLTTSFFDNLNQKWILEDKTYYYYKQETTAYEPLPRETETLKMWPNPAAGNVQLELEGVSLLQVFGSSGQLVMQYELNPGESNLDVSGLPSGIYYVKAKSDEIDYTGKLVVQQ